MKSSSALLLPLAAISGTTLAGDTANTWEAWSTTAPAPAVEYKTIYSTVTTTEYSTTTETETDYSTVVSTETDYSTITETETETDYSTVVSTETDYSTVTETETETESAPPVTVPVEGPATTVTVVNSVTVTEAAPTVTITSVSGTVETVQETVSETVSETVFDTATITEVATSEVTVSASCLSGLVTCPTRIINPTYTPPAPLPSDYLWGCPPGSLCHPKRENCNFEQNPPADTYFCAPEECLPVAELPSIEAYYPSEDINATCAWLTPIDDYFNINPVFYGLDFDIFNIYGQPTCSPLLPPVTETVTVDVPTTIVAATTVEVPVTIATTVVEGTTVEVPVPTTVIEYTTIIDGTTVEVPVPTTIVQITTITYTYTQPAPVKVSTSTEWATWASAPPKVTKRAEISEHDLVKRQVPRVASQCYGYCNYAGNVYQSVGKRPSLCDPEGPWSVAYQAVIDCGNRFSDASVSTIATVLIAPELYCRSLSANAKREALPTFRFARG